MSLIALSKATHLTSKDFQAVVRLNKGFILVVSRNRNKQ